MKGIEIIFRRGRQRHKSRIKGCKRKLFARQEELEQLMKEQSDEEKKERLTELKAEIKIREEALNNGITKPIQDLGKSVWVEHCGCLLFDCKRHENIANE